MTFDLFSVKISYPQIEVGNDIDFRYVNCVFRYDVDCKQVSECSSCRLLKIALSTFQ